MQGYAQPASAVGPATHALVVGISNYQSKAIPALRFADKDARLFADFLQTPAGGHVPVENITLLLNDTATFAAIYGAMSQLLDKAGQNDQVYFYFSGHGDVESQTVFGLGYLLAYNSPPNNYINHAIRLEDLNYFANTLSSKKNVKVILITDACRSGKLAGDAIGGRRMIGEQLRKVLRNEVRIASCGPDELSAENDAWGGGRGVFSYYLLNGLKGLAASNNSSGVTGKDIMQFLSASFSQDEILIREKHRQTPIVDGNIQLQLSNPGPEDIAAVKATSRVSGSLPAGMRGMSGLKAVPVQPIDFVTGLIRQQTIDQVLDFSRIDQTPPEQFPFRVLDALQSAIGFGDDTQLKKLRSELQDNPDGIRRFNERMAGIISDRGHEVIGAYLQGDRAELEKRSYYNIKEGEFNRFVSMYGYALRLLPDGHFLYRGLQVDRDYFQGVLSRMQVNIVPDGSAYLAAAMRSLQQANQREPFAPYVHNELGSVYGDLGKTDSAIYHYRMATELASTWAVPWANLVGLYNTQGNLPEARLAASRARALQPDLFSLLMNEGVTEELSKNWLRAEELYTGGLKQNTLHFFPYFRLARVYGATLRYAESDSNYFESEIRRMGYFLPDKSLLKFNRFTAPQIDDQPVTSMNCFFPTPGPDEKNALLLCMVGWQQAELENAALTEFYYRKAATVGPDQFLPNHYYGKWLYRQQRWKEAEYYLAKANAQYLDGAAYEEMVKAAQANTPAGIDAACFAWMLKELYYPMLEDAYLLADIYKNLAYYQDAEHIYRSIIQKDTSGAFAGGYHLLAGLLAQTGRYEAAEKVWLEYRTEVERTLQSGRVLASPYGELLTFGRGNFELEAFYRDMISIFPKSAEWNLKAGSFLYEKVMKYPIDYILSDPDLEARQKGLSASDTRKISQMRNVLWPLLKPVPGSEKLLTFRLPGDFPYRTALEVLTNAAGLAQDDEDIADACLMVAQLYQAGGKQDTAAGWYARALDITPDNASLRKKLAENLQEGGYKMGAFLQLDTLFAKDRLLTGDYLSYLDMTMLSGRHTQADSVLQQTRTLLPLHSDAITSLSGKLSFLKGDWKNAIPCYRDSITAMPASERSYAIATLYAVSSQRSEAMQWLNKSLQQGFPYGYLLRNDPVWSAWRTDKEWQGMMGKHKAQFRKYEDEAEQ